MFFHNQNAESKLIIASAWLPEQKVLRSFFSGQLPELSELEKQTLSKMKELSESVELTAIQRKVDFLLLGVGVFQSLEKITTTLSNNEHSKNCSYHFVGTGGQSKGSFDHAHAAWVSKSCWIDFEVESGTGFLPEPMKNESSYEAGWVIAKEASSAALAPVVCGSTYGISGKKHLNYPDEVQVENLEVYSLARGCSLRSVPWSACIGISNELGSKAHQQWKANHVEASCLAQLETFKAILKAVTDS